MEATDSGTRPLTGVERLWNELKEESVAGLDPAERAQLLRLLGRVDADLSGRAARAT